VIDLNITQTYPFTMWTFVLLFQWIGPFYLCPEHPTSSNHGDRAERDSVQGDEAIAGRERAYFVAGVSLADERMVRAGIAERNAWARLKDALRGADLMTRIEAFGAGACAELRPEQAANDP
jgi:hypothetical protein